MKQYDDISRINSNLDIVDVAGNCPIVKNFRYISNDRYAGYTGSHSESEASFIVTPSSQKWSDKATGYGGLAFNLIALEVTGSPNPRGHDFKQALEVAAKRAGITLSSYTSEDESLFHEREELIDLYEKVNEVFVSNLQKNTEMLDFLLKKHGITPEKAKEYGIGYAIGNEELKQFDSELLVKSGLVFQWDNGKTDALFKHRITYPYYKNGRIVYFAGRETKYSPESENTHGNKYKKLLTHSEKFPYVSKAVRNDVIFGQDSIIGKKVVHITEGIGDTVAAHIAGLPAISPITTVFPHNLESKLIDLLSGKEKVYIINDNDPLKEGEVLGAGEKGAIKTAKLLESSGIPAFIVMLPKPSESEKMDLAEYLIKNSPDDLREVLNSDCTLRTWEHLLSKVGDYSDAKTLDKIRDFKKFISTEIAGMDKDEWEIFVREDVRVKFCMSKKDAEGIVKGIQKYIHKPSYDNGYDDDSSEGREAEQSPDSLNDYPSWVIAKAEDILNNGNAFSFIHEVWQKKHVGDENIGENCLCSVIASRILNSKRGLHIKPSGESGKGKSDAIEQFLTLLPAGSYITGSMSAKALFYDPNLKAGTLIYSDDASFNEDTISTIKQSTSEFQNSTIHRTVVNGEFKDYTIPARVTFWFSAVEGMDDDQLANRFLHADVDSSSEQDEKVHEHQKEMEAWYESDEVEPDVLVCRCIFSILFKEFYRVKIPFVKAIEWNNKENRRNFDKFKDVIRAVTVYNYRKRENFEGFLMATPEDYETALKIYKGTSVNNATNLTDTEIKYLRFIVTRPNKTTTLKELVNHFKVSETAARNMLNGKKGNGGLLAKIKQLIVIDSSTTTKNEVKSTTTREKFYQYTGEFTGLDMYESISCLNTSELERVTSEFKATLLENKARVTKGNLEGNLSRVTPKNDSSINNNIINNTRVTQNMGISEGKISVSSSGDGHNFSPENTHTNSEVTPLPENVGYPQPINSDGSPKNGVTCARLPLVTLGYPQPKNNNGSPETLGYPSTDDVLYIESESVEMVTPQNVGLFNLLRKALVKFAKERYHEVVPDIDEFVRAFNNEMPEYKKVCGNGVVSFEASTRT